MIQDGSLVWATKAAVTRLVYVHRHVAPFSETFAICSLVHTAPEMATASDFVIEDAEVVPWPIVIQADITGPICLDHLGDSPGTVDVDRAYRGVLPLVRGTMLWAFKTDEGEAFRALQVSLDEVCADV